MDQIKSFGKQPCIFTLSSLSQPKVHPFNAKFKTFFYGDPCGSIMLTSSNHWTQSPANHMRVFLSHRTQVTPATASNECPFNLYLIAEWHFPCLLLPSVLSENPAGSDRSTASCFTQWCKLDRKHCQCASISFFLSCKSLISIFMTLFCTCDFFTMWNSWLINIRVFSSWL